MNLTRLFAIIDKRTEELKAELRAEAEREPGEIDSPWCTIAQYAQYAGVHEETVRRWIMKEGLPTNGDVKKDGDGQIVGTRKTCRINRDEADAWRKTR